MNFGIYMFLVICTFEIYGVEKYFWNLSFLKNTSGIKISLEILIKFMTTKVTKILLSVGEGLSSPLLLDVKCEFFFTKS